MSPRDAFGRVAQYVANGQLRYFHVMEYGGQPSTEHVEAVPLDIGPFGHRNHGIPHQMTEVYRSLEVVRRVEDVFGSGIFFEVSIEIFLLRFR
jgi:hypothetical protein